MFDIFDIIKRFAEAPTVSGCESAALPIVTELLADFPAEVHTDRFGNIKAVFGGGKILIDAHIDKIGLVVTSTDDMGFLHIDRIGGLDQRCIPAGEFTVFGREPIPAYGVCVPPHLATESDRSAAREAQDTVLDAGFSKEEAEEAVKPGDRVMYKGKTVMLGEKKICSPYLDNSVGAAVLLRTLELLSEKGAADGITLCFSAGEEAGLRGASPAVFGEDYSEVIVVDTSFASSPGVRPEKSGRQGAGPMIGFSPVLDSRVSRILTEIAEDADIPHTREIMGGRTGTNADVISCACSGFCTSLVSVPIRNMHTPSETVSIDDIENTAKLICEYIMKGGRNNEY